MTQFQHYLSILTGGLALAALVLGFTGPTALGGAAVVFGGMMTAMTLVRLRVPLPGALELALAAFGLVVALGFRGEPFGAPQWLLVTVAWLATWLALERLAHTPGIAGWRWAMPLVFGVMLLVLWEVIVVGANVPSVILPPPSQIGARIAITTHLLWADFQQTFLKSVLAGYVIGCGAGFVVAVLIDRSPFLKRGLLPIGNFVSALPIIGIAPIMVMWFGFDWQSKAAVVVVMTFFPMLVNTIAGLNATGRMERDLMATYAAGYSQTLLKLRLPQAAPFIFNALKINSTLALIGAIVAEFFGTPTVGMGFRISTEVGRLNVDMVWAEIAMAALAGSVFYGVVVLVERAFTFWHPAVRNA
jgi:NitT/TauT family transport system permease protein